MSSSSDRGTRRPKIEPEARAPKGEAINKECGCSEQTFNDGTVDTRPCMPHAFQQMADALITAGNAVGYIGLALDQQGQHQRAMAAANEKVDAAVDRGELS